MGAHLNKIHWAAVMGEVLCKVELDELTVTKIPTSITDGKGEMLLYGTY